MFITMLLSTKTFSCQCGLLSTNSGSFVSYHFLLSVIWMVAHGVRKHIYNCSKYSLISHGEGDMSTSKEQFSLIGGGRTMIMLWNALPLQSSKEIGVGGYFVKDLYYSMGREHMVLGSHTDTPHFHNHQPTQQELPVGSYKELLIKLLFTCSFSIPHSTAEAD